MRKERLENSIPEKTTAIGAEHLHHPVQHFGHPRDVLAADDIDIDEKRAILASWASDIFAIDSSPALRLYPGTDKAVSYDEIIEALKTLDLSDRQGRGAQVSKNARQNPQLIRRMASATKCFTNRGLKPCTGL